MIPLEWFALVVGIGWLFGLILGVWVEKSHHKNKLKDSPVPEWIEDEEDSDWLKDADWWKRSKK